MRSAIVYYSYTGNTKKVVDVLVELLREKGQVDLFTLEPLDESKMFFGQVCRAIFKKRAKIEGINFNLSGYDLICLGTPVWAFSPVPAMNSYLDRCFGLEDKFVVLFVTYGSGHGVNSCLNYMQKLLSQKKIKKFSKFSVSQFKVDDKEFVRRVILEKIKLQ